MTIFRGTVSDSADFDELAAAVWALSCVDPKDLSPHLRQGEVLE